MVIFAVSMFSIHAEEFVVQKTLSADYDRLQDWYSSVVRIEITKGATVGTNAAPPEVEYKIIEVLRKGRFPLGRGNMFVCGGMTVRLHHGIRIA